MTTFERRQRTLDLLRQQPGIRVPELARTLAVSEGTVRNDLTYLQQAGALTRVRGGAVVRKEPLPPLAPVPANHETVAHPIRKSALARWAADLVDDGDSILNNPYTAGWFYHKEPAFDRNGQYIGRKIAEDHYPSFRVPFYPNFGRMHRIR